MQSYFSIMAVAVLLIIVVAIFIINKKRQASKLPEQYEPRIGPMPSASLDDDGIIAVRKRERKAPSITTHLEDEPLRASASTLKAAANSKLQRTQATHAKDVPRVLVIYVMAKNARQFAGYELLQSLLTVGMRFGDMNIFHRHHELSGTGPLLFSLASATEPGTFDIHNMGAFSGKGLTLFMQYSGEATIDIERYELMVKTAQQLAEDLDGILLDDKREALTKDKINAKKRDIRN